jgi:hypothetical protein
MRAPPLPSPGLLKQTHRPLEQTSRLLQQTVGELLDTPERLAAFCAWHGLAPATEAADLASAQAALRDSLPADELLARLRARFPDELARRSRYQLAGVGDPDDAPLASMLPPRARPFVGRTALLLALRGALAQHGRVALVGPPGVGRRALGRELIARQAGEHHAVAWLRASDAVRLRADLLTLWAQLVERGLLADGPDRTGTDLARLDALHAWLGREPRCLLVLATPEPETTEPVQRLLQHSAGPVLICGLLKQTTSTLTEVAVPPLDRDEALALAATVSGRHRLLRGEAEAAHEVVEALSRLPALVLAVAREVAAHGLTWLQCRDELRAQAADRAAEAGGTDSTTELDGQPAAGAFR